MGALLGVRTTRRGSEVEDNDKFSQSLVGLSAGAAMMTSRVLVWRLCRRRQKVKSSFDHDLGKRSVWGLGWFCCPSSNPGNAIVVRLLS